MQLIYHSWTPLRGEIGPSKNEVALPKILLKRRHNPEKGGLIKKWGGVGSGGVATFLLLYRSIAFTVCVCRGE